MARDPYDRIFEMSAGHELEIELRNTLGQYFLSKNGKQTNSVFRFATEE